MKIIWMELREARDSIASRNFILILTALLMLDGMFIMAHLFHVFGSDFAVFRDPRFSIARDRGYSEWYEYFKSVLCILALAGCYRSSAQPVYWGLSVVYGLILADNALSLHEDIGFRLARWLTAKQFFDDVPQAFGELAHFAIMGLVAMAVLIGTFRRSRLVHQARGTLFLFLIIALAGFAVGIDLLHAALRGDPPWLDRLVGTIEDGGETIVLSISCAAALTLFLRMGANRTAI